MLIVGLKSKTKNGYVMRVIEHFNNGYIISMGNNVEKYCSEQDFINGNVLHPYYDFKSDLSNRFRWIDISGKDEFGRRWVCIKSKGRRDIDIMFEDNTIVRHTVLTGYDNMSPLPSNWRDPYEHLYESRRMDDGCLVTLTGYDADKVTVEFEDGTVRDNVDYCDFYNRCIKAPRNKFYYRKMRESEVVQHKNGESMRLIRYYSNNNCDIMFSLGDIIFGKSYAQFKYGTVRPFLDRDYLMELGGSRYKYEYLGNTYTGTIDEIVMRMKYGRVSKFFVCNIQSDEVCVKDTSDGTVEHYSYRDLIRLKHSGKLPFILGL